MPNVNGTIADDRTAPIVRISLPAAFRYFSCTYLSNNIYEDFFYMSYITMTLREIALFTRNTRNRHISVEYIYLNHFPVDLVTPYKKQYEKQYVICFWRNMAQNRLHHFSNTDRLLAAHVLIFFRQILV